ncbi:uncharacterized protein [Clytia hemisphaerica]|uniref:uncharacterized protein n=1 Tax=Clytia hemisphaerica TaxID=252671 RepID=UPI0034D6CBFB
MHPYYRAIYALYSLAWKSSVNATIGGVGILVKSSLLSLIQSIDKISDRIVSITIKGNPKTTIISCYSPHSGNSDLEVEQFFEPLTNYLTSIPRHSDVSVCGDFNAHLKGAFSYHSENNRNSSYLQDSMNECNLLASNTCFQKRKTSLWTWKSPSNQLSQIDYILCRKCWRNSIHDCQVHSSSDPVGSDHRIVVSKCKLSLRSTKKKPLNRLNWNILENPAIATAVENKIQTKWTECTTKDYKHFSEICMAACMNHLPVKKKTKDSEPISITNARRQVLQSKITDLQRNQTNLKNVYVREEDIRITHILNQANKSESTDGLRNAWKLVKELSGKKKAPSVSIKSNNPKKSWKDHFETLLNNIPENVNGEANVEIDPVFQLNEEINIDDFTLDEVNKALKQMKNEKAAGLGLPLEFWKLDSLSTVLLHFCNATLNAYGIPDKLVNAIQIMYTNNRANVMTSEGETEFFDVVTGVLQGDPLAHYPFIIVLDYALRTVITSEDGFTIEKRRCRRHHNEKLADLDFADDISLLNETVVEAENPIC